MRVLCLWHPGKTGVLGVLAERETGTAHTRDMTRRTRGISLPQLIEELAPYLLGWRGYFGFCQTPRVLTNLEAWIRRRLRSYPLAAVAERAHSLQ